MDANRLREIEVRLKKATPGEWFNKDDADGNSHYTIQSQDGSWIGYAGQRINAVLIAHAPKDLQDLLEYVRKLVARVAFLECDPTGALANENSALRQELKVCGRVFEAMKRVEHHTIEEEFWRIDEALSQPLVQEYLKKEKKP